LGRCALDRAEGDPEFTQVRHEEMSAFMASVRRVRNDSTASALSDDDEPDALGDVDDSLPDP
jgi:hypothetical protein